MNPDEVMKNSEDWHKKNASAGCIDEVKRFLKEETETVPYFYTDAEGKERETTTTQVTPIPILHNEGKIFLQFCGWSINLLDDGTWYWEDTTGG
jgi:hypothetical protein